MSAPASALVRTDDAQPLVPVTEMLATAAEVKKLDVAAIHEKATSILADIRSGGVTLQKKHIVQFYEDIEHTNPNNSQQMRGNCMCCLRLVASTGSHKLVEHLQKCPLCPREVREAFSKLSQATVAKSAAKREADTLAEEEAQLAKQEHERRQGMLKQQCIKAGIKESEVSAADLAIAMFFYANAIPFSAAATLMRTRSIVRWLPPSKLRPQATSLRPTRRLPESCSIQAIAACGQS
jgi:hypothetical protein